MLNLRLDKNNASILIYKRTLWEKIKELHKKSELFYMVITYLIDFIPYNAQGEVSGQPPT